MLPLTILYEDILRAAGCTINDAGGVSFGPPGAAVDIHVEKRRLVVPYPEVLKHPDLDNTVIFHPLCENATFGESPVLKKLRDIINVQLTTHLSDLMFRLVKVAADHDRHKLLNARQRRFLQEVPEADEKTVTVVKALIAKINPTTANKLVNVHLRKGGTLNGRAFNRTAMVSFPITDDFEPLGTETGTGKDKKTVYEIFGVEMRRKDKETLIALLKYMVPNIESNEVYSIGSSSPVAAYFDTLVRAFASAAGIINDLVDTFEKCKHPEFVDANLLRINLEWLPRFDNLSQYRDTIPPLPFNDGTVTARTEQKAEAPAARAPQVPVPQAAPQTPAEEPQRGYTPPARFETPVSTGDEWARAMSRSEGRGERRDGPMARFGQGGGDRRDERDYRRDERDYRRDSRDRYYDDRDSRRGPTTGPMARFGNNEARDNRDDRDRRDSRDRDRDYRDDRGYRDRNSSV